MKNYRILYVLGSLVTGVLAAGPTAIAETADRPAYRSPIEVAFSPDGSQLAVADRTWPGVVILDASSGAIKQKAKLEGDPYHVAWNGADKVLVAEGLNGTVAEVDAASGNVLRRIGIGLLAKGLAVADGKVLSCDRQRNKLVVASLASGQVDSTIDVGREPGTVAVTPDGKYAVVGNKLPRPTNPLTGIPAAEVSIVNLATKEVRAVPLAKGTTMVRTVIVSPDSKWAYVTHQSPRGNLPVTQLDNGWTMTNAMSIIDLQAGSLYANFIFDHTGLGAGNPWGAAINKEGTKLWVSLAGVREVATVDLAKLQKRLESGSAQDRLNLLFNLNDLYTDGTIKRTPLETVEGTRGLALSPDGKTLAVAAYFSGKVLLLSTADLTVTKEVALPDNPAEDDIRTGERFYYSALNCYQKWLSCASCHDEGRMDTLNWDLTNDGTGNPKQTKSHLFSSETPPTNISGCRENALVSSRAGYMFIQFQPAPEDRVNATYSYMKSLRPEPSPYLGPDGQLTPDAVEGKKIFEDSSIGCANCHAGQYFTDLHKHDVGTRRFGNDGPDNNPTWDANGYDTPTLIEVWRTAPYLHLGTSMTIKDVLTASKDDTKPLHGNLSGKSDKEIDQLAAYVLQIGPTRDKPAPIVADAGAGGTTSATGGSGGGASTATKDDASATMSSGGSGGAGNGGNGGGGSSGGSGGSVDKPAQPGSCACALGAPVARTLLPMAATVFVALFFLRRYRRRQ
jgi:DNA-binding beta-propeller fold protein YncE